MCEACEVCEVCEVHESVRYVGVWMGVGEVYVACIL